MVCRMQTNSLLSQILGHLDVVRGPDGRGESVAWCKFHPDGQGKPPHTPNLRVSAERGWFCDVCNRGGSLKELAQELGISMNSRTALNIVATYDYRNERGDLLYQVVRLDPKGFRQRCPVGNGGWTYSLNGTRRVPYRLPDLLADPTETVWIVEGEKDVDRLRALGLVATTNPMGAGKWRSDYSEFLRNRDVVIIPDNDPPGEGHAQDVAKSLQGTVRSIKVVRLPGLPAKGDVSDWLSSGGTREELLRLSADAEQYDPKSAVPPSGSPALDPSATSAEAADDPHRLARAFLSERGVDEQGRLTLRYWRDQWWRWDGHRYYPLDKAELRAEVTAAVKGEFDRTAARDAPQKVSSQVVTNTLQALSSLCLVPSNMEQPSWLGSSDRGSSFLAMANGLLDLDRAFAGEADELLPHTPQWFSPVCVPYDFDRSAECSRWINFLEEIFEGDQERITLLQEWFGYCLTMDTSLQKFLVLEGEGANGKSVVCDVLASVLGHSNVSHVPLESFGHRFQLTMTLGKLANIASEVGDLDKAAEGTLKAFTAGDRMYFDRKGLPGIEAYPTARLVLATNNRPRFTDRSGGLWRRMIVVTFQVSIPEEKQNPRLAHSLREELPGIFIWAMLGLDQLRRRRRFTVPKSCTDALAEYQLESNPARMFLEEHVEAEPGGAIACGRLYQKFAKWCGESGYRPLGERMFGKEVFRRFPHAEKVRLGGRGERAMHYQGLVLPVSDVSHVPYDPPIPAEMRDKE